MGEKISPVVTAITVTGGQCAVSHKAQRHMCPQYSGREKAQLFPIPENIALLDNNKDKNEKEILE